MGVPPRRWRDRPELRTWWRGHGGGTITGGEPCHRGSRREPRREGCHRRWAAPDGAVARRGHAGGGRRWDGGRSLIFRDTREETTGGGRHSINNPRSVLIYSMLVDGSAARVQINPSLIHDIFEIRHIETIMYQEISCSDTLCRGCELSLWVMLPICSRFVDPQTLPRWAGRVHYEAFHRPITKGREVSSAGRCRKPPFIWHISIAAILIEIGATLHPKWQAPLASFWVAFNELEKIILLS